MAVIFLATETINQTNFVIYSLLLNLNAMANFETTYLGLALKSPLIVSSSGLNSSVDRIKKYEEMGAGAIVLKSLFEEQIMHEVDNLAQYSDYTEAAD